MSVYFIVFAICLASVVGQNKKVRLMDVQVLTLYKDQSTTGQRSSPVRQLKCVGGSAGCGTVVPSVVQCYNRGTNGFDVEWECKAEMDNAYKFGNVQVTCEGFEYPDDPYILQGSCGLEYSIDYASNSQGKDNYRSDTYKPPKKSSIFADVIFWVIIALFLLVLYRIFVAPSAGGPRAPPSGAGGFPGGGGPGGGGGRPPPGFRPDYYPDDSCSGSSNFGSSRPHTGGGGGAGFWTGLGAGGLLGYLFGNQGGANHYGNRGHFWDSPGPSYGRSGSSWTSSAPSSSSFGSGSRSASGFGGTRRR